MKENPVFLLWSPVTWDDVVRAYGQKEGDEFLVSYCIGKYLAEWNLVWLFCYDALSNFAGPRRNPEKAVERLAEKLISLARTGAQADAKHNTYGAKDMAETRTPTEFIAAFMRRPYRESYVYSMCEEGGEGLGDEIFERARLNAPKLEETMLGEVEIGEDGVPRPIPEARRQTLQIVRQSSNVIAFPFRGRR
jgi:hypothetical protein